MLSAYAAVVLKIISKTKPTREQGTPEYSGQHLNQHFYLIENNSTITDKKLIANTLNQYFVTAGTGTNSFFTLNDDLQEHPSIKNIK